MAGISQTIPNYYGGISEQPDQLKNLGQVKNSLNAIPDVTYGLYKRPGSRRIVSPDQSSGALTNVQSATPNHWFHYYRDEAEGSYIGQIASDGTPRIWRCSDGKEMTISYGATDGANATNLKSYLTATAGNLTFTTCNDTTFVVNRTKATSMADSNTPSRNPTHQAYIELLRTENGRQYGLNINDTTLTETNLTRATRVKIENDNLSETWGTGNCPGVGTQVFGGAETNVTGKTNLTFRLTTLGQTGDSADDDDGDPGVNSYRCSYNRSIDLLHGGEGWDTNDTTPALGASGVIELDSAQTTYEYQIKVVDSETTKVRGTINSGVNGIIRPAPTPWDAQTAVTADTILGGINAELAATGLTTKIIGNGIHLSSSSTFNVEVVAPDLMRVMQDEINDVSNLPTQCKHGYIVKIANSKISDEDDYYMKFVGQNTRDGPGSWEECAAPGIRDKLDSGTMPVTIKRIAATTFLVDRFNWDKRIIGDDKTNPIPTFVSINPFHPDYNLTETIELRYINKVLFFRNRLTILSGQNVITSQPGDFGNFWANTALTVSNIDVVDISLATNLPTAIYDGIEVPAGLIVFTANSQHLLSSDDTIFNPDTAKLRTISNYNYNIEIPPISLGTTIGFIDNSNKYSRFNEMINVAREAQPTIFDQTKVVPALMNSDLDLLTNSKENGLIFFGKENQDTVFGYKYITIGDQRVQSAWFKWEFNNPVKYHFTQDDRYYDLDSDNFLQYVNLMQSSDDPSINEEGFNYLIHLDNWTTISSGVYNASTKLTTFTNQSTWIPSVTTPSGKLVLVDINTDSVRVGRYAECTLTGNTPNDDFTVPGNWDWSEEHSFAYTSVNASNEQITLTTGSTDHGLETGDLVRFVEGTAAVGGLTSGNSYYVIDASINNIALASNLSNANAGVAINITSQGTGTHKVQKLITDLYIGYLYDYQVDFPRLYSTKQVGQNTVSDTSASLVLHRINLSLGKVGLYETTLTRLGKANYTEVYESTALNQYNVSDAPYVDEVIRTLPVYDRNKNVDLTLKSTHPSPCTLRSLQWEGDYSNMYYQRV